MEAGLDDRLAPLVGQTITAHAPLMGGPPRPIPRLRITEFRGIYGVLEPVAGDVELPEFRPGVPIIIEFDPGQPLDRLECVVAEPPAVATEPMLLLRFPRLPERRKQARHYENFPVIVQPVDEAFGHEIDAMAVDISAGGLRMRCDEPLRVGQRIFVTMRIPNDLPAIAIAEVVADPRDVGHGGWEIRMRFATIADEERGRLIRYVAGGVIPVPIG
jgi:hypothetical protein